MLAPHLEEVTTQDETAAQASVILPGDMHHLFEALHARGYRIVGPTVRDSAVVYDELDTVEDLPIGWTDEQGGGSYRLRRRNDESFFGFTTSPHSWKQFLHPSSLRLWRAQRTDHGFEIEAEEHTVPKLALFGVRPCELHAIERQDEVYLHGDHVDADYRARRKQAFVVAVQCTTAGGTCFCVSMATGPDIEEGFDLALTEVLAPEQHYFVVDTGSARGAEVLAAVPHRPATDDEVEMAACHVAAVTTHMGRTLETEGLKELLYHNFEHPHWDEIAGRCLACGNCTMVCPTCFCSTIEDVTDLTGRQAERWRRADSCFTTAFSYIYGGSLRASLKARYRQWMTHKLATWVDQFGTFGCVGCGRCITWCPVGIDITREAEFFRSEGGPALAESRALQAAGPD
jgi:ferredoxin